MIRLLKLIKPEYLDWYLAKDKSGMVVIYEKEPIRTKEYWGVGLKYIIIYDPFDSPLINLFESYKYTTKPIIVRELIARLENEKL